jgi:hypothetical protein
MSKPQHTLSGASPVIQKASYSIDSFCDAHDVSRPMLYQLWKRDEGPDYFFVGEKRLISVEAATRWRQEREAAARKPAAVEAANARSARAKQRGAGEAAAVAE